MCVTEAGRASAGSFFAVPHLVVKRPVAHRTPVPVRESLESKLRPEIV